ncbi:MAG: DUF5333 domain-containing protein [Rhodobacteraceae bacterium]|nr:DUF5333 domain-containing protein [Paracoccaceae bacterium]
MRRGYRTSLCHAGLIVAAALSVSAAAAAKPPLREVAPVYDALFHVAVANEIRKSCDSIVARPLRALSVLRGLNATARQMGYSRSEIDAFLNSENEKNRMRARGAAFFAARNVNPRNPDELCALGRAEIQKSSQIGVLLRAK